MSELRGSVLGGREGWLRIRDRWAAVAARQRVVSHLQSFVWVDAFGKHFAVTPEARWFFAEDRSGPLAILPLRFTREKARLNIGVLRNDPFADGVVASTVEPASLVPVVLRAFRDRGERVHMVSMTWLRPESAIHGVFAAISQQLPEGMYGGFCTIDTSMSGEAWYAAAPKKLRSELRRRRARLEERGSVEFAVTTRPDQVGEMFDEFVRLESSGWKGERGALLNRPLQKRMLDQVVREAASDHRIALRSLRCDGQLIAAQVGLRYEDRLVSLKVAYDEDFAGVSPGNLLRAELVKGCCDDPAVRTVDFWTRPTWASHWRAETHPTFTLRAYDRKSVRGAGIGLVERTMHHRERHAAPEQG